MGGRHLGVYGISMGFCSVFLRVLFALLFRLFLSFFFLALSSYLVMSYVWVFSIYFLFCVYTLKIHGDCGFNCMKI